MYCTMTIELLIQPRLEHKLSDPNVHFSNFGVFNKIGDDQISSCSVSDKYNVVCLRNMLFIHRVCVQWHLGNSLIKSNHLKK